MKNIKVIGIILGIIAWTITITFTVHNTYASKDEVNLVRSEVNELRKDIRYIRQKVDNIYLLLDK